MTAGRDWLALLVAGLERLDVPVEACRATCGEARLVLAPSPDRPHPLVVTASRDGSGGSYGSAAGLFLRYRGATVLEPAEERALQVLARLLEGLGPRVPADLDAATVRVAEGTAEHEALREAFPFCTAERAQGLDGEAAVEEVLVRLTARCNQACPFCSAPLPLPDPPLAAVWRLLDRVVEVAPGATVTFTGGEPTLREDLAEIVARALVAAGSVEIQTNAVRLGDGVLAAALPASPGLRFFVSLHGMDEATYDRATGTRGMLGRALEGVRALLRAGHEVVLSCVVSSLNVESLVQWVEAVAEEVSGRPAPALHFSITLCPEHRPEARGVLVRYSELGQALAAAAERARQLGLAVEPLLSSTHAAIPACMVEGDLQRRAGPPLHVESHETGGAGEGRAWVKGPRCCRCPVDGSCLGVPAAYAERFGLDELDPERVRKGG